MPKFTGFGCNTHEVCCNGDYLLHGRWHFSDCYNQFWILSEKNNGYTKQMRKWV